MDENWILDENQALDDNCHLDEKINNLFRWKQLVKWKNLLDESCYECVWMKKIGPIILQVPTFWNFVLSLSGLVHFLTPHCQCQDQQANVIDSTFSNPFAYSTLPASRPTSKRSRPHIFLTHFLLHVTNVKTNKQMY